MIFYPTLVITTRQVALNLLICFLWMSLAALQEGRSRPGQQADIGLRAFASSTVLVPMPAVGTGGAVRTALKRRSPSLIAGARAGRRAKNNNVSLADEVGLLFLKTF